MKQHLNLILAWSVHILTAFGLIMSLYSIISIINEDYNLLLKLTILAILIDGIDGTLARRLKVKEFIPTINGELLDNIVDYLNYTFVPTIFFYYSNSIENEYKTIACIGILFSSAYQFSRIDAKTSDNYFKGFPSLWNLLIIFNIIFTINQITNLIIILLCIIFSFIPIKFIYPSKNKEFKYITFPLTVIIILLAIPTILIKTTDFYLNIYGTIIIIYCSCLILISIYLNYKTKNK